ncbi:hypothetical protein [Psychroserpens luteolus]|uniref:hypothetical protein n=1 Tax=Psychroserpens luteolus TaxID=2855840 RepID=UPI001E535511|nr:hypothetical protein [Psychroserpens luteolus]MCD2258838.1 hypothetical protein [Psychroserpens luteolus]
MFGINNILAQEINQEKLSKLTYDYSKDELTGKMPFDDYFKIIFKGIDPNNIYKAYLFEVKYEEDKLKVKTKNNLVQGPGVQLSTVAKRLQNLTINKNKEHKSSSQSIVSPLDPERTYVITVFKKNSDSNQLIFNNFFDMVSRPASVQDQINYFKDNIIPLRDNLDKFTIPISAFPSNFAGFIARITPILGFYNNPINQPNLNAIVIDPRITPAIISTIANSFKDKDLESKTFNEVMPMFLNGQNLKIQSFSFGMDNKVKIYNYDQRIINLKNNIKLLEKLKKEVETLQLIQNNGNINLFYTSFVINEINTLKSNLQSLVAFNVKLKNLVNAQLPEIILIHATTLGNDLKTSNSSALVPDVGIVNAVGYNSSGDIKYIARPYLGLNWHFSGINRTQYLREIPNLKFRHRWSVSVGITLGKIDTEDYEDFYNGISPTLGMNYRLTRQIRVGFGTLFVREKKPNPIVENTKVELAPYLSLSFDLGLFSEASKLTKLIGF